MQDDKALIAQIGKTIGLWGDLKLHIHTDFPEQFQVGNSYSTNRGELVIKEINLTRGMVSFVGYDGIDFAKKLTNTKIFTNEAKTKESCELKEGQHFWFDIVGSMVMQDDMTLGSVLEVQRLGETDYLYIQTDSVLVADGLPKTFLVPYIDRYVINADTEAKVILTKDAKDILEAS
ncbi:MAG: ribosome maturation factor RimM [Sulfurovum sp.]